MTMVWTLIFPLTTAVSPTINVSPPNISPSNFPSKRNSPSKVILPSMTVSFAKKAEAFISSGTGGSLEPPLVNKDFPPGIDRSSRKREEISFRYLFTGEGFLMNYLVHKELFKGDDLFGVKRGFHIPSSRIDGKVKYTYAIPKE